MPILLNSDRFQATQLFDKVIRNCPEILSSDCSLYFISRAIGWFKPQETVRGWLEMLLAENSNFHYQAYGELLFVYYFQYQDRWSEELIRSYLHKDDNELILCGLAHASCHLCPQKRCQKLATEILCSLVSFPSSAIENTLGRFFRFNREHFQLNSKMRKLIKAFCNRPIILVQAADDLIDIIEVENLLNTNPELIVQVCQTLLNQIESQDRSLARIADSLTTIAIQLHRQSEYKEFGLDMFEKLLSLNLMETKAALETLDRKPNRANFYVAPRKRLRRKRASTS